MGLYSQVKVVKNKKTKNMAKKATIADVLDAVRGLNERLAKLEDKKDVFTLETAPTPTKTTTIPMAEPEYPVPTEYRTIVDEILNPKFGIKIEPDSDRPAFTLKIFVPKEYSNATEEYWRTNKCDVRAKVLTYGEGQLGVRAYVELIKANLGSDIMARVATDK